MYARRWVALCAALGLLAGGLTYWDTPTRYRSGTTLEMTADVPWAVTEFAPREVYVQGLYLEWSSLALHEDRLDGVAKEFGLYTRERRELTFNNFILRFRNDITFSPLAGDTPTTRRFMVSFEADDPQTAIKVSARLASLFVEAVDRENAERRRWLDQMRGAYIDFAPRATAHFRVIDPGTIPATRVGPSSLPYLATGLFVGVAMGIVTPGLFFWWQRRRELSLTWIFGTALLGAFAGFVAYHVSPPVYRASALLRIPQQGRLDGGAAPVIGNPRNRLRTIREQVGALARLDRKSVHVDFAMPPAAGRHFNLYSLAFDSDDPRTAVAGAERVAGAFFRRNVETIDGLLWLEAARRSVAPVSPQLSRHLAAGTLGGLFISIVTLQLLTALRRRRSNR